MILRMRKSDRTSPATATEHPPESERQGRTSHARVPKQERSRASYERLIEASIALLEERGYVAFTLGDVSRRAKVSIGSIYGRIPNKDALIREVQARVLERMDDEFSALVTRIRRKALPLRTLVLTSVAEFANFHRRHAAILHAFMDRAPQDPLVSSVGRKYQGQMGLDFKLLLLERRHEFVHPDPERAAEICFVIAYSSLARYLGLGALQDLGEKRDWTQFVEDLAHACLALLLFDPKRALEADSRAR
jgi:AcrR family transcriptional regulator